MSNLLTRLSAVERQCAALLIGLVQGFSELALKRRVAEAHLHATAGAEMRFSIMMEASFVTPARRSSTASRNGQLPGAAGWRTVTAGLTTWLLGQAPIKRSAKKEGRD